MSALRWKLLSRHARVTWLTSENTILTSDIHHGFIALPFYVANSISPLSSCLLLSPPLVFNHLNRLQVNTCSWMVTLMADFSLCVFFVWLSAEKWHAAERTFAVTSEPQTTDGHFPSGGAAWRTGPLPLHHPVFEGCNHLQLWGTHCQRYVRYRKTTVIL